MAACVATSPLASPHPTTPLNELAMRLPRSDFFFITISQRQPSARIFGRRMIWGLCAPFLLVAAPILVPAQDRSPDTSRGVPVVDGGGITKELVEQRRQQADSDPELADSVKVEIEKLYGAATSHLETLEKMEMRFQRFNVEAESAKELADATRAEIVTLEKTAPQPIPAGTLAELEQIRVEREQTLQTVKASRDKLETKIAGRAARRRELLDRVVASEEELTEVNSLIVAPPPTGELPLLTLAKQTEWRARLAMLTKELPTLNAELSLFDVQDATELLRLQRDRLDLLLAIAERELRTVQDAVRLQRERAANEGVEAARMEAESFANDHPVLQEIAERIQTLAEANRRLTEQAERAEAEEKQIVAELEELSKEFTITREKVNSVGLPASMGALLREQRNNLSNPRLHQLRIRQRQQEIDAAHLNLIDLRAERSRLGNLNQAAEELLGLYEPTPDDDRLVASVVQLLIKKKDYLEPVMGIQGQVFETLADTSNSEQQLVEKAEQFATYIDENVLWIRSSQPLSLDAALRWDGTQVLWPSTLWDVVRRLRRDLLANTWTYFLFGAMWVFIAAVGVALRGRLATYCKDASRTSCVRFSPTIKTSLILFLLAAPWPMLLWMAGWRLSQLNFENQFSHALAAGLLAAGLVLLPLEYFRQVCRKSGLAEAHFQWASREVVLLRRHLNWFVVLIPALTFVSFAFRESESLAGAMGRNGLERLVFMVMSMLCALFLSAVLHPRTGVFREYFARNEHGWVSQTRYLWYTIVVGIPFIMLALAAAGFDYTARRLSVRLYGSATLLMGLLVVYAFVMRLVLVQRRSLQIAQTRQRSSLANADHSERTDAGNLEASSQVTGHPPAGGEAVGQGGGRGGDRAGDTEAGLGSQRGERLGGV